MVKVPSDVFAGMLALRANPDLNPEFRLIECLQFLGRAEEYWPTQDWIVQNIDEFWIGWDEGFVEKKDEAKMEAVPQ
jgi:hypothetical protein